MLGGKPIHSQDAGEDRDTCSGFMCLCSSLKEWSGLCFEAFLVNGGVQKDTIGLVCKNTSCRVKISRTFGGIKAFKVQWDLSSLTWIQDLIPTSQDMELWNQAAQGWFLQSPCVWLGGHCFMREKEFIWNLVWRDGEQLSMEIIRREQVRLKIPTLHFPQQLPHQESKAVCFSTHFCTMGVLLAVCTKNAHYLFAGVLLVQ